MFEDEKTYKAYIDGMDQYIEELVKLKEENPREAQKRARESLIRSGVLDIHGNQKKQICD